MPDLRPINAVKAFRLTRVAAGDGSRERYGKGDALYGKCTFTEPPIVQRMIDFAPTFGAFPMRFPQGFETTQLTIVLREYSQDPYAWMARSTVEGAALPNLGEVAFVSFIDYGEFAVSAAPANQVKLESIGRCISITPGELAENALPVYTVVLEIRKLARGKGPNAFVKSNALNHIYIDVNSEEYWVNGINQLASRKAMLGVGNVVPSVSA